MVYERIYSANLWLSEFSVFFCIHYFGNHVLFSLKNSHRITFSIIL